MLVVKVKEGKLSKIGRKWGWPWNTSIGGAVSASSKGNEGSAT